MIQHPVGCLAHNYRMITVSSREKLSRTADLLAQAPGNAVGLNVCEGLTYMQERLEK